MTTILTPEISIRTYGSSPGSHTHDYFQVLWSLDGTLELEIEGRGLRLSAGAGIIIAPNERHDFESHDTNRSLVLNTSNQEWAARQRQPVSVSAVDHLARFISESISRQLPVSYEMSTLLLEQSWGYTEAPRRVRRQIDWLTLKRWVVGRLSQSLRIVDLANHVCLSQSQFRARCYAERALSPQQWLTRIRYEQVLLLRSQGLSVSEVAHRVGYDSPSAMTAAMRKLHVPTQA
ncbi:AraC family transcriptional regulator [Undibacterium sp. RuRC25W]|uniref:AraC family transcriptional regulator n=1 Tax=Undibacterium sp. RuRC25W TaxID=3413047 RepID=UPI003BF277B0